jgi:hypothetical protein
MNDGALNRIDMPPLSSEQAMQSTIPNSETTKGFISLLIRMAITQVVNPIILPTEISKCPDIIRIVIPAATRPRLVDWDIMLLILVQVINLGLMVVVTTPMIITNANSMTGCENKILPSRLLE